MHDWTLLSIPVGSSIKSQPFTITGTDRWIMEVYPHGIDANDGGCVSMALCNISIQAYRVHCNVLIFGKNKYNYVAQTHIVEDLGPPTSAHDKWYARKLLTYEDSVKWSPENTFAIQVELIIAGEPEVCTKKDLIESYTESIPTLHSDLQNMLKNGYKSDIILCAGDETINCHQCILMARSNVFKRKLTSTKTTMKMAFNGGRYYPNRVSQKCLKEFVGYIYTDSCRYLFKIINTNYDF